MANFRTKNFHAKSLRGKTYWGFPLYSGISPLVDNSLRPNLKHPASECGGRPDGRSPGAPEGVARGTMRRLTRPGFVASFNDYLADALEASAGEEVETLMHAARELFVIDPALRAPQSPEPCRSKTGSTSGRSPGPKPQRPGRLRKPRGSEKSDPLRPEGARAQRRVGGFFQALAERELVAVAVRGDRRARVSFESKPVVALFSL